ncbi:hypothetical protein G7Y89_g6367 [Cudoniella acicularis]|uniref:DUS-like FMN-binding domain-containing protein n=1 Tax=Cudoniella acicularis TaxID=354080 RepID=A0A8H4RNZ2_9HELO|nr:hypothetical protein G7Y89_g6367 [Cudoniella acicularis]
MNDRSLVSTLIAAAKSTLSSLSLSHLKTVSVKIRIHKDLRDTMDFIRTVEDAGVDFITIHGRMRSTPSSKKVDLEAIRVLAGMTRVPTLANGDVFTRGDALSHVKFTGVDGVMAARGLLENPALFARPNACKDPDGSEVSNAAEGNTVTWEVVETFMNNVVKAPLPFKLVVHHLSEMCGSDRSQRGKTLLSKEERGRLMECKSFVEVVDLLDEVRGEEEMEWKNCRSERGGGGGSALAVVNLGYRDTTCIIRRPRGDVLLKWNTIEENALYPAIDDGWQAQ